MILLMLIVLPSVVLSLFVKWDQNNGVGDRNCGLRYVPTNVMISYPIKCFKHRVYTNITIDDIFGSFQWNGRPNIDTKIYKGLDAEFAESPWTVVLTTYHLFSQHYYQCTGILINKRWIITSAHCNYDNETKTIEYSWSRVRAGPNRDVMGWVHKKDMFIHPNFTMDWRKSREADIALYKMNSDMNTTIYSSHYLINGVCLPTGDKPFNRHYDTATVFGWGLVSTNQLSDRLQKADIALTRQIGCYDREMMCSSGGHTNPDTRVCSGDSGAGLVQYIDSARTRAILIGLMATIVYGVGTSSDVCDETIASMAFVSIPRHINWILQTIKNNSNT
ncbi:kallikrein-1E2-like [Oppia nitens]|uniref:kallikrein-1E2-like n=1 Tax=Oppia nitens TaxID=1686743 RepID=UPI0023DC01AC|nr:kallikrein-1E2-like [Oppia nitens]